ncbi:hypothetical protein [Amycolatopsis sp. FDAARGOS 1241]|uniref:hypothetical protein n=1 Tax=Amycolatopsis sp. FDAARGOS 1241 TaxID=2778070 RepID=UPI0019503EBF|nr:hypothetical protein [Amycolatopsis sp. FDAARGOS 1241]QRP47985.1 hypothetical protein I6J71_08910 [Amycolatopsis sp. FDAARGOS 1241]
MSTFAEGAEVLVVADSGCWGRAHIRGDAAVLTGEMKWQDAFSPPAGFVVPLDSYGIEFTPWEDDTPENEFAEVIPIGRRAVRSPRKDTTR